MIRQAMNILSWIIIAGGVAIALVGGFSAIERGGGLANRAQDAVLFGVFALVTIAAGGVLQMLVRIDERLELNGSMRREVD